LSHQRHATRCAGQSAGVQDHAREHEEGHRHQREAVGAVDEVLRDDLRVEYVEVVHRRHPQTIREREGMPIAMALSSEKRKTGSSRRRGLPGDVVGRLTSPSSSYSFPG
jgi:hypothetical protein